MKQNMTELALGLWFVQDQNRGKFPYSNSLLIEGDQANVLVDTGLEEAFLRELDAWKKIHVIIHTHYHIDHMHGDCWLPQAEIWAQEKEVAPLESQEIFLTRSGLEKSNLEALERYFKGTIAQIKRRPVTRALRGDEVLAWGDYVFQVILTPGHTSGHIALYEKEHKILFAGDMNLSPLTPWYGNPCSDPEAYSASLEILKKLDIRVFASSHNGLLTEKIAEKISESQEEIKAREKRILEQLDAPRNLDQLMEQKVIYPLAPKLSGNHLLLTEIMIQKHLEKLLGEGRIGREGDAFVRRF